MHLSALWPLKWLCSVLSAVLYKLLCSGGYFLHWNSLTWRLETSLGKEFAPGVVTPSLAGWGGGLMSSSMAGVRPARAWWAHLGTGGPQGHRTGLSLRTYSPEWPGGGSQLVSKIPGSLDPHFFFGGFGNKQQGQVVISSGYQKCMLVRGFPGERCAGKRMFGLQAGNVAASFTKLF